MSKGMKKKQIAIRTEIVPDSMSPVACKATEEIVAELVARAYIGDSPELFGETGSLERKQLVFGSPAAAAAVEGAPPSNEGGPD